MGDLLEQSPLRVRIEGWVCDLDVGLAHPPGVDARKGWTVRPLRRYTSWVQNVVKQFGFYLLHTKKR